MAEDSEKEARLRAFLEGNPPPPPPPSERDDEASAPDPERQTHIALMAAALDQSPFPFEGDLRRVEADQAEATDMMCLVCGSAEARRCGGSLVALCDQCRADTLRSAPEGTGESVSDHAPRYPEQGCCVSGRDCYRQFRGLREEEFGRISATIERLSRQHNEGKAAVQGASKAIAHYKGSGKHEVAVAPKSASFSFSFSSSSSSSSSSSFFFLFLFFCFCVESSK